jgi:8-oxo-dGTP diphosphatase
MDDNTCGVCIVLLNSLRNKVLLGRRKNSFRAGTYGLPAGLIEENESITTAALRELQEETSIKMNKLDYLGVIREFQSENNRVFIHFAFQICIEEKKVQNMEPDLCEEWRWYRLDDLPSCIFSSHEIAIKMHLENYRAYDLGSYIK